VTERLLTLEELLEVVPLSREGLLELQVKNKIPCIYITQEGKTLYNLEAVQSALKACQTKSG
jgi:hypothetical protein